MEMKGSEDRMKIERCNFLKLARFLGIGPFIDLYKPDVVERALISQNIQI